MYRSVEKDLKRLSYGVDKKHAQSEASPPSPTESLDAITQHLNDDSPLESEIARNLRTWLETRALPYIDGHDSDAERRYDSLITATKIDDLRKRALQVLENRLPIFVYFDNYIRVRPNIHLEQLADRIDRNQLDELRNDFGNRCLLKLLGFTARELSDMGKSPEPDPNDLAAFERYRELLDTRMNELNAASVRLTGQIREVWQPDKQKGEDAILRLQADQQYLKVVVEDELGVDIELDQRSEGFQWLVSFFVVFSAEATGAYNNAVLLLDEPGLSLHGLKQREFRKTVSRLAEQNQTIFTTHSPFLVGSDELDLVRVVEMKNRTIGTKVHTTISSNDPAALLPLQEALGYDLAQSLFAQQRNLILEGLTDYWYLEATSQLLRDAGLADLNDKIALVFSNTAGKVVYFATILHAHHLKVAALLDSDAAGHEAAKQDTLVHALGNKAILRTKDAYVGPASKPEIEDLLRDTLVDIAKNDAHLKWDVEAIARKQPSRPITDIFESSVGKDFSKYRLAKAYLRWVRAHSASDLTQDERDQWTKLIGLVNNALK